MKWLLFSRKTESLAADEFDRLLEEVIEDFELSAQRHRERLLALREAMRGR